MTNYLWKDNPTEANVALYDPDVLNECLMHLKYSSPKMTPFCLNSASMDSSGKANLLSFTGNTVKFNCGNSLVPSMNSNSQDVWSLTSSHSANTSANDLYKSFDSDGSSYCAIGHTPSTSDPVFLKVQKTTSFSLEYVYLKFASIYNAGDIKSFFIKNSEGTVIFSYDNLGAFLDKDEFLIPLHGYSDTSITIGATSNVNGVGYVNFPAVIKLLDKSQVVSLSNAYGASQNLSQVSDITISSTASQTHNIYLGFDGTTDCFAAAFTKGAVLPASPVANQVHLLTSVEPCVAYIYNGTDWGEYAKIPVGYAKTNSGGAVFEVVTFPYNQNAYEVNSLTPGALTKVWVSNEYTPIIGTATIVAHNLSLSNPLMAKGEVLLRCVVAEAGYSVGDYVSGYSIPSVWLGAGSQGVPPVLLTANSIQTVTGTSSYTGMAVAHKTYGTCTSITLANWRYVFRIWY